MLLPRSLLIKHLITQAALDGGVLILARCRHARRRMYVPVVRDHTRPARLTTQADLAPVVGLAVEMQMFEHESLLLHLDGAERALELEGAARVQALHVHMGVETQRRTANLDSTFWADLGGG